MPLGLWHFALSVGVCSLVDNNNNNKMSLSQERNECWCATGPTGGERGVASLAILIT